MEKYSQYRDKGSGVAPFFPVHPQPSGVYLPLHILLFIIRVPILIFVTLAYILVFSWLPIGSLGKKAALGIIMGVPGLWWIDLQIDGVKRGTLSRQSSISRRHLPGAGSIIAASSTSPIDALYLAAIFDPVFTTSYPNNRLLHQTSLLSAMLRAFAPPALEPSPVQATNLTTLEGLMASNPDRPIVVFPECTTTNGRGILPLSPSLLSASPKGKIFPTNLRYTPQDITTPIPGTYWTLLWNLCSRPTHTIRVRIAEYVQVPESHLKPAPLKLPVPNSYATNFLDSVEDLSPSIAVKQKLDFPENGVPATPDELELLDRVGEALARLGRVKRVALGAHEKAEFVRAWTRRRR